MRPLIHTRSWLHFTGQFSKLYMMRSWKTQTCILTVHAACLFLSSNGRKLLNLAFQPQAINVLFRSRVICLRALLTCRWASRALTHFVPSARTLLLCGKHWLVFGDLLIIGIHKDGFCIFTSSHYT